MLEITFDFISATDLVANLMIRVLSFGLGIYLLDSSWPRRDNLYHFQQFILASASDSESTQSGPCQVSSGPSQPSYTIARSGLSPPKLL